jgi:hypothetical protein
MRRVVLIHWKPEEAEQRLESLRNTGVEASLCTPVGGDGLRGFDASPPDAFVIDLTRLPSQGLAVGAHLRRRKATRMVPLLFAGGEPEKVTRARKLLPDAHFVEWNRISKTLPVALRRVTEKPVVPGPMADYEGTPLPRKLGIKPGSVVALVGAPDRFERKLEPLPDGVRLTARPHQADRVLQFARSMLDLVLRFPVASEGVRAGGSLWIIWPKQASGVETDLTQPAIRRFAMDAGWVDYKICAVDDTWSGLCFSRRRGKM